MRISRKWLSQYMDISDLSIEELASRITDAGLEVESVESQSQGTNLVIGQVIECTMHPDSDHLHCTKVDVGDEILSIVCGAPNVAEGQKVIVAKPGAKLPGGEIKKGAIRGQESNGMICALFELGVDPHLLTEEQKMFDLRCFDADLEMLNGISRNVAKSFRDAYYKDKATVNIMFERQKIKNHIDYKDAFSLVNGKEYAEYFDCLEMLDVFGVRKVDINED